MTVRILDCAGRVLREVDDHIRARHILQAINSDAGKPIADSIVDEQGRVLSSMRGESGSGTVRLIRPIALRLPSSVHDLVRAVAGANTENQRDMVRDIIGRGGRAVAVSGETRVFKLRVTVEMHEVLAKQAHAAGVALEAWAAGAVVQWASEQERKVA